MRFLLLAMVAAAIGATAFITLFPETAARWLPSPVAGLIDEDAGSEGKAGGAQRSVRVVADRPTVSTARTEFVTTGTITAKETVQLASELSGRVVEVFVEDGSRVEKGDPIVRFDDAEERAAVSAAESALREAQRNLERKRELGEDDYASEATIDDAKASAQSAESQLQQAKERLKNQTIRAPFPGRIGFIDIAAGAYLSPGSEIARLATTDRLRATAQVPQSVVGKIEIGSPVSVVQLDGGETIQAQLDTISPLAGEAARSVTVEARLDEPKGLRPGAFVEVRIVTEKRDDALFISESALLRRGRTTLVYIVGPDNKAREVVVETGERRNGKIEIRAEALSPESRVVVSGLQKIEDGTPVKTVAKDDGEGAGSGDARGRETSNAAGASSG